MLEKKSQGQTAPDGDALASSAVNATGSASPPAPPLASRLTSESDSVGERRGFEQEIDCQE